MPGRHHSPLRPQETRLEVEMSISHHSYDPACILVCNSMPWIDVASELDPMPSDKKEKKKKKKSFELIQSVGRIKLKI